MTPRVTFWATAAALAVFNVARALGAFGRFGDAVGLMVALAVVAVAWRTGLDRRAMGLTGDRVRSGLAWGGAAFGLILAAVVAAAVIPATSGFLDDDRARLGGGSLVFEVVVSILLLSARRPGRPTTGGPRSRPRPPEGPAKGALASSAVFGLWHIAPTLNTAGGNAQLSDAGSTTGGTAALVVAAVVVTFVAGMVFSWLRLRSGSVLAPMLAHLGTNGVTLVVAWFALR